MEDGGGDDDDDAHVLRSSSSSSSCCSCFFTRRIAARPVNRQYLFRVQIKSKKTTIINSALFDHQYRIPLQGLVNMSACVCEDMYGVG